MQSRQPGVLCGVIRKGPSLAIYCMCTYKKRIQEFESAGSVEVTTRGTAAGPIIKAVRWNGAWRLTIHRESNE